MCSYDRGNGSEERDMAMIDVVMEQDRADRAKGKPTFANHDRETRFWLSTRDRADCRECAGHGCTFCYQTGKQLSREDLLLADSQADGEGTAPVEAPAPISRVGKTVECWDCGTPYVVKSTNGDNGQCVHCYLALKL